MWDSKGTVNIVHLIGRLGADPELKYTPQNTAMCVLSIATNKSFKTSDGLYEDRVEWHRVVAWRKTAEAINKYGRKGIRVFIAGSLTTRSWDDKDGNKRYTTEVVVDQLQFLEAVHSDGNAESPGAMTGGTTGTRNAGSGGPSHPPDNYPGAENSPDFGDDLPF